MDIISIILTTVASAAMSLITKTLTENLKSKTDINYINFLNEAAEQSVLSTEQVFKNQENASHKKLIYASSTLASILSSSSFKNVFQKVEQTKGSNYLIDIIESTVFKNQDRFKGAKNGK